MTAAKTGRHKGVWTGRKFQNEGDKKEEDMWYVLCVDSWNCCWNYFMCVGSIMFCRSKQLSNKTEFPDTPLGMRDAWRNAFCARGLVIGNLRGLVVQDSWWRLTISITDWPWWPTRCNLFIYSLLIMSLVADRRAKGMIDCLVSKSLRFEWLLKKLFC